MNRLTKLLCAGAVLLALTGEARADATFDRKAVVERVAELVDELYVDPKTGKALAEHLRQNWRRAPSTRAPHRSRSRTR